MKIDFAKLFADPKNANLSVKLGDAEFTVADLLAYDQQRGGDVMNEIKRMQAQLKDDQTKLAEASTKVAETYIQLEAEKKKLASAPKTVAAEDPLDAYANDQVLGPVVAALRKQQAAVDKVQADITAKLDMISKSVGAQGTALVSEKAARDFAAIMSKDDPVRPKDLSLDQLYKVAVDNRLYERGTNLPDLNSAYESLTRNARHAHELEQARADERAKVAAEQAEAAVLPMPGHGSRPQPHAEPPAKNLNDAFSKAGSDKDLWKQINSTTLVGGGAIQ